MNDFEELARRSAGSIHTATDELPVTDLADRPSGGPVILGGLALATLLVLVGLFSWSAFADDNAETEIGPFGTDDDPAVDADFDPDFRLEWVDGESSDAQIFELEHPADVEPLEARTWLYESEADDLLVAALPVRSGTPVLSGEGTAIVGSPGYVELGRGGGPGGVAFVRDGTEVALSSHTIAIDGLIELAETLVVSGLDVSAPGLGLALVATGSDLPFTFSGLDAWFVTYGGDESGQTPFVSIAARPGTSDDLSLRRFVYGGPGTAKFVDVRGEPATLVDKADGDFDLGPVLMWIEQGWLVQIQGDGDLVALAERLQPASPARWAELLRASEDRRRQPSPEDELVLGGEFDLDGERVTWHLTIDPDQHLCFTIYRGDGGSGSCGGPEPGSDPVTAVGSSQGAELVEIWGSVREDVDSLTLRSPDGTETDVALHESSYPARLFAVVLAVEDGDGAGDYELVAYDASGAEIGSSVTDAVGSTPSTPPDGMVAYGLADGVTWTVAINDGDVCINASGSTDGTGMCSATEPLLQVSVGESVVFGGVVPPCVVAIEFDPDGERGTGDQRYATPEESGGWGLVVPAELVDGASRTHLLDVDGEVVASLIGRGETVSCPA